MLLSKIRPGELDRIIVIESNTPTRDSISNEELSSWSTLATVRAARLTNSRLGARFNYEASQQVATNIETYLIRYSSDVSSIDESMRWYESGTSIYYYITALDIDKRREIIVITAEKKDNE